MLWPNVDRFLKVVLSLRIGNVKSHNNRRTRIPMCLGRENWENVAWTRNWCGWPFFHRLEVVVSFALMIDRTNVHSHYRSFGLTFSATEQLTVQSN